MTSSGSVCYSCGAPGHFARDCPQQLGRLSSQSRLPSPMGEVGASCLTASPNITELDGDLMTATDSLCHCVSECLAMGKGIAVLFKQRFGGVDELKSQRVQVGGVAVLDRMQDDGRYIYYLVTKPRYFHKPSYQSLASSLAAMFQHMTDHGVTSVSMPEIGCGLDMLEWPRVREMLATMLKGSTIQVTVYHFRPAAAAAPPAAARPAA